MKIMEKYNILMGQYNILRDIIKYRAKSTKSETDYLTVYYLKTPTYSIRSNIPEPSYDGEGKNVFVTVTNNASEKQVDYANNMFANIVTFLLKTKRNNTRASK